MKPLRLGLFRRKTAAAPGVDAATAATLDATLDATPDAALAVTPVNGGVRDGGRAAGAAGMGAGFQSRRAAGRNGAATAPGAGPRLLPTVAGVRSLPRPALRWVGAAGRIAVREFDFDADAEAVCSFQEDTYTLNFPDFAYNHAFAAAFRHDLRRAALDPQHALFVLDEGEIIGFLWLVICQNTWTGERYGYVNNLYIALNRRGQQLGAELMQQADAFFRSRRIKRVRLTVTAANAAAVHLYQASGYETTRWEMEKEL